MISANAAKRRSLRAPASRSPALGSSFARIGRCAAIVEGAERAPLPDLAATAYHPGHTRAAKAGFPGGARLRRFFEPALKVPVRSHWETRLVGVERAKCCRGFECVRSLRADG